MTVGNFGARGDEGSACWEHFSEVSSTELTDHERTLLCSAINVTLFEGIGSLSETTANELRSLGTRLSCSPEWRAVFAGTGKTPAGMD